MSARVSKKLLQPLMLVAVVLGLIFGPNATAAFAASSGNSGVSHGAAKAAVCKYVGKPGVDERLQTGQNPIVVDKKDWMVVGSWFQDAQGRSVVIAILHPGDPAPPVSDCPAPQGSKLVTPVPPAVKAVCGPNNDSVALQPQPEGIVLESDTGWVDNVRAITYVAIAGYHLNGSGVFVLHDNTSPCPPVVIPVASVSPVVNAVCGPNNDSVNYNNEPTGVLLKSDTGWVNGHRTLTFVAAQGYLLTNAGVYTFTDENSPCPPELKPVASVKPQITEVCGPNNDGVAYDEPIGVLLKSDTGWVNGQRTFTFVAATGYVLTDSGVYTFTDENIPCSPVLTPVASVAPNVKNICGPNNDSVAYSEPTGVLLKSDTGWVNGHRTLIFIADSGYVLTDSGVYVLIDENSPCPPELTPVTAVNGTFIDACGTSFNLQFVPTPTQGVTYVTKQMGNTLVVTAGVVDQSKYVLTNPDWMQQQTDSLTPCPSTSVTPVPPAVKAVCGPNNDSVALQPQPEGIMLESDTGWVNGKRTITYVAVKGDLLTTSGVFTLTDDNTPCPPIQTPVTVPAPAVSVVCGADNDVVTPGTATGVTLASDSGWKNGQRTLTYVAASDNFVIDGAATVTLTDTNTSCPVTTTTTTTNTTVTTQVSNTTPEVATGARGISAQTGLNETTAASGSPALAALVLVGLMAVGLVIAYRRRPVRRSARHRA